MPKADCIFCKVIDGQIPCEKVYEDDTAVAILDINPVRPGHTLVLPRKHVQDFDSCDAQLLARLIQSVQAAARKVMKGMNAGGFNVTVLNGTAAGQEVFHLHFYVVPRNSGDGASMGWPHHKYREGEMAEVAGRIRNA